MGRPVICSAQISLRDRTENEYVKFDAIKLPFILCSPKREARLRCIIQELKTYKQRLVTTIEAEKRTAFADHLPMDDGVLRPMLGRNCSNVFSEQSLAVYRKCS